MKYNEPKIIKEKKTKKEAGVKFWKVFSIEGGLFFVTAILTVLSAFKLNGLIQTQKIYLPTTSWQDFLFSFLFVMFFVLIFVFYKK